LIVLSPAAEVIGIDSEPYLFKALPTMIPESIERSRIGRHLMSYVKYS